MNYMDMWKLADNLTILQITCLIHDIGPSDPNLRVDDFKTDIKFMSVYNVLQLEVENGYIDAKIVRIKKNPVSVIITDTNDGNKSICPYLKIDWDNTEINIQSLKKWMKNKGYMPKFFFSEEERLTTYKKHTSSYYSVKLHAAIDAWEYCSADLRRLKGRSPKECINKYVDANYSKYTKPENLLTKTALSDISKVANWNPDGGAPKQYFEDTSSTINSEKSNLISETDSFYIWQFADELTVTQTTCVLLDINPVLFDIDEYEIDLYSEQSSFNALHTSLEKAVSMGNIKANIRHNAYRQGFEYNITKHIPDDKSFITYVDNFNNLREEQNQTHTYNCPKDSTDIFNTKEMIAYESNSIDWTTTTLIVSDLKRWLKLKDFKHIVFFSLDDHMPSFCDQNHPCFSIKLKAAYDTWNHIVRNLSEYEGHTIHEVAMDYLNNHRDAYFYKNAYLEKTAIEEIARIVNWDPYGSHIKAI